MPIIWGWGITFLSDITNKYGIKIIFHIGYNLKKFGSGLDVRKPPYALKLPKVKS